MKTEDIRILAEIMNETGLTLIEITEKEATIKLEKNAGSVAYVANPKTVSEKPQHADGFLRQSDHHDGTCAVTSPMVGVFFESSAPGAEPYVSIGSKVKKGDVLCIIEAMKVMNEITAERGGEIVDICIENGQLAEFGQCLFRMKE